MVVGNGPPEALSPGARWVSVAAEDAGCCSGPYQLIAAAGAERRVSVRRPTAMPCAPPASARCCVVVPLRRGVLAVAALLLAVQLMMTAAAATLYCVAGDMIRADVRPRLWLLHWHNLSTPEQHFAALDATEQYVAVLERGLLAVLTLSAAGALACALLLHGARLKRAPLLLPWLVWHGCLLVLGSAVSAGGLVFGAIQVARSWLICSVVGLLLAAVIWYWYVQVFLFYLSIRPRPGGRHDTYKMSPLPTYDNM